MDCSDKEILRRLGRGESIAAVCQAAGIDRQQFDVWWQRTTAARVPQTNGRLPAKVAAAVEIERDPRGVPHIYAHSESDLFFGFGFAMAQDRLFQLDYLRRKGLGTLAEILGRDGLTMDRVARTVGLNRIAAARWATLPASVRNVLEAFSHGVNAYIEHCGEQLPIEFDLLDYRPRPWTPIDSLAIECEFQWYLTGRFPIIAIPELARRELGAGPLYEDFLLAEADEESIVHRGEYPACFTGDKARFEMVGRAVNDPDGAIGSNNWVIAPQRSSTGAALVASDPHIAIEAVSCWYQAHLRGGGVNVAGIAYVGMPAIMFGRNERVAWGITNNICSQRDLYQERIDANHQGCFLFNGEWEPARELVETIAVRDGEPEHRTVRFSRNGPVIDDLLPPPAHRTGPVTIKWLGAHAGGWLESLLNMDRARNVDEFREALRPWHVPTFALVFADVTGHIGMHASGRIPMRKLPERGYRAGDDPLHAWQGLIPFEAMPQLADPARGWIASANNRLAPDDYPYPLFGCWGPGWRGMRIREWIEARDRLTPRDMRDLHCDTKSLRAARLTAPLLSALAPVAEPQVEAAKAHLQSWNYHVDVDSVAATIFNVFFGRWCEAVAGERFGVENQTLMAGGAQGVAARLLEADPHGWFRAGDRTQRIAQVFAETLQQLSERLGSDMSQWTWGRLHRLPLKHVLGGRGELGELLNHGGAGVAGDYVTVNNTGSGPDWNALSGAGYRLVADLSSSPPTLLAVDCQSQSGHPGHQHYSDQFDTWQAGEYHTIHLDRSAASLETTERLVLSMETRTET